MMRNTISIKTGIRRGRTPGAAKTRNLKAEITNLQNKLHTMKVQERVKPVRKPRGRVQQVRAKRTMMINNGARDRIRNRWMTSPFARCRLTPFNAHGLLTGIPDSTDLRRILIDHRMTNTFTFGTSGTMNICITPHIPNPIWYKPSNDADVTYLVNGVAHPANAFPNRYCAITIPEWLDLPVRLNNVKGSYDDADSLYSASKARIVTVGWNLTYIGSTMANKGQVVVNTQQLTLNTSVDNPNTFEVYNSLAANSEIWNEGQILTRTLNVIPSFSGLLNDQTRQVALRVGCNGVLKHTAADYLWHDVSSNLTFITSNAYGQELHGFHKHNDYGAETVDGHWPHCAFFDDGWASTTLTISGGEPGESFVLDTIYCIEYAPTAGSSVYALAKQGMPENKALLQAVDNAAKKQPVASGGSFMDTISNVTSVVKAGAAVTSMLL